MNILITGGVGFIGTNTAIYFHQKGHSLTLVDNFSRPGVELNANYLSKHHQLNTIKSDIRDIKNYEAELNKADAIIHLAGQTAVTTSIQNPALDFESNLRSTLNLLEHLRQHNSKAVFIYASTNKVYGNLSHHHYHRDPEHGYQDTTTPEGISENEPLQFSTPYGCSKGAADQYVLDYAHTFKLNTFVLRQSCIYGPFQQGVEDQGWVAHFSAQILQDRPITIFGDGYQVRDLLYVQDLVQAYEKIIENNASATDRVFNVGGGTSNAYSLLSVIRKIETLTNKTSTTTLQPARTGDQLSFISANTKAKQALDWQPTTNLDQGLTKLIKWQEEYLLAN